MAIRDPGVNKLTDVITERQPERLITTGSLHWRDSVLEHQRQQLKTECQRLRPVSERQMVDYWFSKRNNIPLENWAAPSRQHFDEPITERQQSEDKTASSLSVCPPTNRANQETVRWIYIVQDTGLVFVLLSVYEGLRNSAGCAINHCLFLLNLIESFC